jgi:phenylalanyl-tRNA synthetase alpha chain
VEIAELLGLRDLTDPTAGPHAMQILLAAAVDALTARWPVPARLRRLRPLVSIEDNYDRLGYDADAITRDSRYTRYSSETTMLRSHTSAGVPPALRALAREPGRPEDVLLVLPGLTYRRDVVDRLHVGTPHQVDLWRIRRGAPLATSDLDVMIETVVAAVLPGVRWRTQPATHPYTTRGRQIDMHVDGGGWVELGECGLAAGHVLGRAGLDPGEWSGLALGLGLDRAVMLRKRVPDIRLLRAADPRIAGQMLDLGRWRPVSAQPPVRRDLSLVVGLPVDDGLLGDRARSALGPDAEVLESLTVRAVTPYPELPPAVRDRLGLRPDQANALVRVVLRPLDRTLTDGEANELRDRIHARLHEGPHTDGAPGRSSTTAVATPRAAATSRRWPTARTA